MSERFSWSSDNEDVVIKPVQAIAVYLNGSGDVVIRQQGGYGEEDQVVVLPVAEVPKLIQAVQSAVDASE